MNAHADRRWISLVAATGLALTTLAALASHAAQAQPPRPAGDPRLVVFEIFNVDT